MKKSEKSQNSNFINDTMSRLATCESRHNDSVPMYNMYKPGESNADSWMDGGEKKLEIHHHQFIN